MSDQLNQAWTIANLVGEITFVMETINGLATVSMVKAQGRMTYVLKCGNTIGKTRNANHFQKWVAEVAMPF